MLKKKKKIWDSINISFKTRVISSILRREKYPAVYLYYFIVQLMWLLNVQGWKLWGIYHRHSLLVEFVHCRHLLKNVYRRNSDFCSHKSARRNAENILIFWLNCRLPWLITFDRLVAKIQAIETTSTFMLMTTLAIFMIKFTTFETIEVSFARTRFLWSAFQFWIHDISYSHNQFKFHLTFWSSALKSKIVRHPYKIVF